MERANKLKPKKHNKNNGFIQEVVANTEKELIVRDSDGKVRRIPHKHPWGLSDI